MNQSQPSIHFYSYSTDRLQAVKRWLAGKWVTQKARLSIAVRMDTPQEALQLERALWSHTALSFIPHCLATSLVAEQTPIVIGSQPDHAFPSYFGQIRCTLVNLCSQIPSDYSRYTDIIEIVSSEHALRAQARQNYRQYRTLDLQPGHFEADT